MFAFLFGSGTYVCLSNRVACGKKCVANSKLANIPCISLDFPLNSIQCLSSWVHFLARLSASPPVGLCHGGIHFGSFYARSKSDATRVTKVLNINPPPPYYAPFCTVKYCLPIRRFCSKETNLPSWPWPRGCVFCAGSDLCIGRTACLYLTVSRWLFLGIFLTVCLFPCHVQHALCYEIWTSGQFWWFTPWKEIGKQFYRTFPSSVSFFDFFLYTY